MTEEWGEFWHKSYLQVGFIECTDAPRIENRIHRKQEFDAFYEFVDEKRETNVN